MLGVLKRNKTITVVFDNDKQRIAYEKRMKIRESVEVEEDKKVTCPKCDGEGCEHCDDKGYHLESVELDEGKSVPAAYRRAMQAYKKSDTKKVFDILKKKGFRAYAQSDTLVRNMLKKNKGNVQKAAAEIEKKYPGHFKESVEHLDEMQPHGMFGGQKKKSTLPSRPTRIAVSKEFDKVTRSGKMDTMAAKKHLEKKFKITDVRIEKDKNGKAHVTYFQESVGTG